MGIETDSDIDYGRIFGPFPEVGQISKSFFIGLLTTDEQNEHHNIKVRTIFLEQLNIFNKIKLNKIKLKSNNNNNGIK